MSVIDEVRAEEAEARARKRHTDRMQLEAARARLREEKQAAKARRRELRDELAEAQRVLRRADSEYGRALVSANRNSNRAYPDDRDRACDRAFANVSAYGRRVTRLREQIEAL